MTVRLSIIPAGAVTDRSLEPRDLQVLCLLGRHIDRAGWCVRSQVRMAAELDCGRSSVQRSLERLVEAGWVEKKRRDAVPEGEEPGQPSSSYAYRVRLDRDDYAWSAVAKEAAENTTENASESYAENASQEAVCPPVGTPRNEANPDDLSDQNHPPGAQHGHPGAQPYVGTGCPNMLGTNNDPLERPHLERERDARARDREARGLVDFETRWPTAAADDRQRTAYAWSELSEAEREAAVTSIAPFLDLLKRQNRKHVPAGWKYLEEKRWTLLDQPKPAQAAQDYPAESAEAKAVVTLYAIAGKTSFLQSVMRRRDGSISYRHAIGARLLALASAPASAEWVTLDRQQAGAWEDLLREFVTVAVRNRLQEGSRAPWPYPPSKTGKIYDGTGPPDTLMTDADVKDLDQLKAV